jgi:hypothetical protein
MNAKSRDPSNTSSAKIRVIAVGVLESGKIALVLDSKNEKLHVGMDTKISYRQSVRFLIGQTHVDNVQHHQTVNKHFAII